MITLSFLELTEKDCFGHAYIFHPCDMANPVQLHLEQDGLYAWQTGSLEDFFVRHVVLPIDAKERKERSWCSKKALQRPA